MALPASRPACGSLASLPGPPWTAKWIAAPDADDVRVVNALRSPYPALILLACLTAVISCAGCGNDPYPPEDEGRRILYSHLLRSYDLDPVKAQSIPGLGYLGAIVEPLFEYHYLKRPLELQPLLARSVPDSEPITGPGLAPGDPPRELYRLRFEIWPEVMWHHSPCFDAPDYRTHATREVTAKDFEFTFLRIADPLNNCPAYDSFERIDGVRDWSDRITRLRKEDPAAEKLPISALYERMGPIRGVRVTGRYTFELILTERFPILRYWLAFCFGVPTAPEVIDYYNGENGHRDITDWPIGTGPYYMTDHLKHEYIAFSRFEDWPGRARREARAPGTTYPEEGASGDAEAGLLDPAYVGRELPFIDRFEYRRDIEDVSRFGKFVQGYYDSQEIFEETFSQAVTSGQLTPALRERGISLNKQTMLRIWYFAFNMNDDVVGAPARFKDEQRERDHDLWIERNRKLRQAMNLAYHAEQYIEIFMNGRAIKAESPIPPGVFGYDPDYRNPYRRYDPELKRARRLMAEAGYPDGIDPATGKPLKITLSLSQTNARAMEEFKMFARMFGRLGIDLKCDAVTYNAFVEKMEQGSFQFLSWGWYADYPDPQTFLLLLYGPESSEEGGGNNHARFKNARYDFLYEKMIGMTNDESAAWTETKADGSTREVTMTRYEIIREMIDIFAEECPWVIDLHPMAYVLYHEWYHNVKPTTIIYTTHKFRDIDADLRQERREKWNRPVIWPAWVFAIVLVILIAPAVRTYIRRTRR
jgi:ABC-type transport system substrate-binding protein